MSAAPLKKAIPALTWPEILLWVFAAWIAGTLIVLVLIVTSLCAAAWWVVATPLRVFAWLARSTRGTP